MGSDKTAAPRLRVSYDVRLVRKIAEGGMGSLYEGVLSGADGFEKTVAIKTIRETYSADREFVEMFIGEAKLVADLVHQNICQVYHLGRFGKRYYIAMEFISGVNLKELVDRQAQLGLRVPPELGVFIVSRVCRALEYAHTKRDKRGESLHVVHRDVSAKNIMISTEGEVKLTDFGVAKARRLMKAHEGRVRVGNALYMSPEQAKYQPTDGRSDLFSLGVVAFELVTGRQLFAGRSLKATLRNVLTMEIPSPREVNPEIPPSVERILLKTLERDVSRRYQSAGELGYELEYEIYHRGYGPTIVTLEKHLRSLFPWLFVPGTERVRAVPAIDDAVLSAMSTIASGGWTMRAEESSAGERPSARSTAQERPRR